jgi:molecular chaperone GrpE
VTDERDTTPRFTVTDKRRFAGADSEDPVGPGSSEGPAVEPQDADPADLEGVEVAVDLEAAQAEALGYLEHLRRLQAEFDNYRKRVIREQTQAVELAAEPVMRRLLDVVDDFELALAHAEDAADTAGFAKGVELVYAKLVEALTAEGLERIAAQGEVFDPEIHEALVQTGEPGEGELVVVDVLRPGYTLKGRVLRPAGVRVEHA